MKVSTVRPIRLSSAFAACALLLLFGTGCAAKAQMYRREHLVDRIMAFDAESKENARKMKAFEAREGSTGGVGGAGGGCACK